MIVSELIAMLQELDGNLPVVTNPRMFSHGILGFEPEPK